MVGECEIHYLEQPSIAYLRRIFVKEELQKKRICTGRYLKELSI